MASNSLDVPWTPTLKDMEAPQTLLSLKIKIKGAYTSFQEITDIHYHLMKENLMRPIRVGIEKYRACKDSHSQDLIFYSNVRIVDIIFMDRIHHRLQFDSSMISLDKWGCSELLASGSLLVLSYNDFKNCVFAIVTHSVNELLMQGFVDVEFITDKDALSHFLASSSTLVMAESTSNYQLYSHILAALKQAKMCNRLQEYVVKCNQRLERPSYLTSKTMYDMSCINNNGEACNFVLLKPDAWSCFRGTSLNKSQIAAVELALTKELALIQGLPGTGKTFVCHKIIQALLKNGKSPILVLCQTNSALDELLEWVYEFCTSEIIHTVGFSKSSELENLNLDKVLKIMDENKDYSNKVFMSNFWEHAQMLAKLSEQIAEFHSQLENLDKRIQAPEVLMEHMNRNYREAIKRGKWSVQSVADWLCENERDEHENKRDFSTQTLEVMKVLKELSKSTLLPMSEKEEGKVKNIKLLKLEQRLGLYKLWITKYRTQLSEKLASLLHEYNTVHNKVYEIRKQKVVHVLENKAVIGMTPSTAAKYSTELKTAKCKIVIVDDAANMLESNILVAINQWCEHLILIGDHRFLAPKMATVELNNNYGVGVSLFERLIQNDIPSVQLNEQYEICPQIADLKRHLYPNIRSNCQLLEENDISGISKNVFFIDHNHKTNICVQTRKEVHVCEADFLVSFCKYLLFMGHVPSTITVLTTNVDQMLNIKEKLSNIWRGPWVMVKTVDGYIKREDDIILLSFITNKEEITANLPLDVSKVSYAFSRAKRGFYAIGDFDTLKSQSKQWSDIVDSARASGNLAEGLPLSCGLKVTCAEGFNMYISFKKLQDIGSCNLNYDLSTLITINQLKAAMFRIKCEYCMLKIGKMEMTAENKLIFKSLKYQVDKITESTARTERNRLWFQMSTLLYLVVITKLEHICLKRKQMFSESLKLPIMSWKVKLSCTEIDEEMIDNADDFVEMLMTSMMKKDAKGISIELMKMAREVDEINKLIFSKDSQALCDLIERKKPLQHRQMKPQIKPPPRSRGKVIHGRQLYWYLADKTALH